MLQNVKTKFIFLQYNIVIIFRYYFFTVSLSLVLRYRLLVTSKVHLIFSYCFEHHFKVLSFDKNFNKPIRHLGFRYRFWPKYKVTLTWISRVDMSCAVRTCAVSSQWPLSIYEVSVAWLYILLLTRPSVPAHTTCRIGLYQDGFKYQATLVYNVQITVSAMLQDITQSWQ